MATAMKVAEYIGKEKFVYGEMHLQKILYYAQAWSLAWSGRPLFSDEIEAWVDGPVVRHVWVIRKYGGPVPPSEELDDEQRSIVDAVYSFYGTNGGGVLSGLTHLETPWTEARAGLPKDAQSSAPVSQATMRRFYTQKALSDSTSVPKPPSKSVRLDDDLVSAAGRRQANRWRGALDALATR